MLVVVVVVLLLVAPAFVGDALVGFCANRAHHADIGAEAPGSMPVTTRLSEEGLLISPTLLMQDDEVLAPVLDSLLSQLRDGDAARGDFSAQVAANRLGVHRLETLAARTGDSFLSRCDALQDYAERGGTL